MLDGEIIVFYHNYYLTRKVEIVSTSAFEDQTPYNRSLTFELPFLIITSTNLLLISTKTHFVPSKCLTLVTSTQKAFFPGPPISTSLKQFLKITPNPPRISIYLNYTCSCFKKKKNYTCSRRGPS